MIDIRHHIYSLAAVFLALAVGIVIGTSLAKSMPSDSSGRRTIQRYERVMHDLRGEILKSASKSVADEAALKGCEEYCRAMMPFAVKNKLYWRNVAVVQTGDNDDLTGSVKQALEMAGAEVTCTADISSMFPFTDDTAISQALIDIGLGSTGNATGDRDRLFKVLAGTVCSGKSVYLVPKLEKAGIAVITGNCNRSAKLVVLVGGASSETKSLAQSVDAQLVAAFAKSGVSAVGCEPSIAAFSYVPVWHKAGIASIDNADSAMGQTCLIYALNGEVASFGVKKTADRLIPKTMESQ